MSIIDAEQESGISGGRCRDIETNFSRHTSGAALYGQILHYRTALDQIFQGVCFFSADRKLILSNRRYAEMYGLNPEGIYPGISLQEVAERRFANGACPRLTQEEYLAWCDKVNYGSQPRIWVAELQDGRTIRIYHQPMPDGGWVSTHEDVTDRILTDGQLQESQASLLEAHKEQAKSEKKIAHLVSHDALTGLPNRAAFAKRLVSAFDRATTPVETFAVLCIDLDHFKGVNEFFGHTVGDLLLRAVAQRLQEVARHAFIARTVGDEFMLLLEGSNQPSAATSLADELLEALAADFEIDGQRMRLGLSIGIAIYPPDGDDEITLLGNADAALHRAKADGRGLFRFFDADMDASQRERATLQRELRSAVAEGELVLHYQPQAQIGGEIFGFEALVRWHHPTRGLLLPGSFIPLAEESGLISDIGKWVLQEACREAASWKRPLQIAVNVSPTQFGYSNLPDLVSAVLSETGLAPGRLELEITEGVVISNPVRVLSILRQLKVLGAKIAMDDFGKGYSSLASLQSFPFDKIKIDREFVSNLGSNENSTTIVRAIIGLGHNLRMPVIAEGVETEEQRSILAREGCKQIQGYLVGRPLSIDRYTDLTDPPDAK
jgi:diguanylate cyclase